MAKARPPGSSKPDPKESVPEVSGSKSSPEKPNPPAEAEHSASAAPSKVAAAVDSPSSGLAPTTVPASAPLPSEVPAPPASAAPAGTKSEPISTNKSAGQTRPPSVSSLPKPIAESKPVPKAIAEAATRVSANALVETKPAAERGATVEVKPVADSKLPRGNRLAETRPVGATTPVAPAKPSKPEQPLPAPPPQPTRGVPAEARLPSTAISPKSGLTRDTVPPAAPSPGLETAEFKPGLAKDDAAPAQPAEERVASAPPSAGSEAVAKKEPASTAKSEPSALEKAPETTRSPAEQMRSLRPTVPVAPAPISEEEIVRELPEIKEPEPETAGKEAPAVEAPAPPPPAIPAMFVVMVAPELAPVAKVGGLADVVYGLSRELELRGNAVEIILPKYDCMRYDHIWGLTKTYENLWVPWFNGGVNTSVWFGFVHGRKCFFIDPHSRDNFFNRGVIYGHNDDLLRFAFFCRAALEFMFKTGKAPEIIHCHDWQTALVPVLLYEVYQHLGMRHPRVCFTVHNFRHQGVTGEHVLRATGLHRPEYFFHYDRLRDNHNPQALNLMKGGIVYSNFVTTVSPRHAWEAKDGGQAHGLERTLHLHHYKYGGVLNGLDYDQFNPNTDPHIPSHYNIQTIEKKYDNKRALRRRLWLADNA